MSSLFKDNRLRKFYCKQCGIELNKGNKKFDNIRLRLCLVHYREFNDVRCVYIYTDKDRIGERCKNMSMIKQLCSRHYGKK